MFICQGQITGFLVLGFVRKETLLTNVAYMHEEPSALSNSWPRVINHFVWFKEYVCFFFW